MSKLRRFESEHDWTDVEYQFATRYIGKFEKKNIISVNILAIDDDDDDDHKRIFIRRKSTHNYRRTINLMLVTGEKSFPDEM